MNQKYIIKDNKYFNLLIKKSRYIKNDFFIIYINNKDKSLPKFGFAVGKKVGNAVTRNKIKRRIKNIVRTNIDLFSNCKDYIIVAKKSCKDQKYDKLEIELINLIKKGDK